MKTPRSPSCTPPAQTIRKRIDEIRALFPGWRVWHSSRSGTWNAYRAGEDPDFRRPPSGRRFMVSTYDATDLVALLEFQVRVDIRADFPGWRVRRAGSGGWYAFRSNRTGRGDDVAVRLVHDPVISGLRSTLRALAHQKPLSS